MYDLEKRKMMLDVTVGEFCEYLLQNISKDAVFHVGGVSCFYVHVDKYNTAVSVDDSDLGSEYAEDLSV